MNCRNCENWNRFSGYCTVCSCEPMPTGNPKNCSYFKNKK